MRHFCISVTLLDLFFHGKGDRDEPEWPPSPMRVFQALVAGSRAGCRERDWSDTKAAAFRWLEQRDPPQIIAPEAKQATAYILYVPNNDGDKKFERWDRLTSKVARPHKFVSCDNGADQKQTLHYLWSIPENEWLTAQSHVEILCREGRYLMALGWGIDQAVGTGKIFTSAEIESLTGQRWQPWFQHRPGQRTLRIPTRNSLDALEQVHKSFLNRVNGRQFNPSLKFSQYSSVMYLNAFALPPRSYAVFEFPDGVGFRQEESNEVAAMLRSLACELAKRDTHGFPGGSHVYVAGHVNGAKRTPPRFSYMPLPTIGHQYVDGMIRRVLIAEPYGEDGSHARWAQNRLCNGSLKDIRGNERGVLLDLWRTSSRGIVERYVNESRIWTSVTPVVLPGFDDGNYSKAQKLCLDALRQAELPVEAVEELTLRKAPYWLGSLHPAQYRRPQYLRQLPAWHLRLVFREAVPGPLAVGAGRHCGLGVLAGSEESQQ
jgi:CRISPR-associated protein Csb2